MAVTYGFYDSLNHDRLYNAQQMSAIFDGIINDGVFMSVGNQFHTVAGTGMQVIVKSGRAWFDSTWTLNDAEYPLSIDAADVLLTRIDAVVLEVNSEVATRANTIKVVKGTPASAPAKPTLTNTATVHQHALAYVTVAKNITAITNSMIEIVVGKTETPYVTAILQTTDITDLFNQWEDYFQTWFDNVRSTLDGDVALNLQNQITSLDRKTLLPSTPPKIGLSSSATGDDMFNVLCAVGDLYVWKKTVTNSEEVPAAAILGPVENKKLVIYRSSRSTCYYADKLFVADDGTVSTSNFVSYEIASGTDPDMFIGKYFYMTSPPYVNTVDSGYVEVPANKIIYIPTDAIGANTTTSDAMNLKYLSKYQLVTGSTPKTPAGTTITCPVSTILSAYQEGDNTKPAGYTLGDAVTGKYIIGWVVPGNTDIKIDISSDLTISDNGTVSMSNPSIGQSIHAASSDLLGKFIRLNTYGIQTSNVQGYEIPSDIIYIPQSATITAEIIPSISSTADWVTIDRYQTVTGYASIPPNTIIEYLGKLGDKARIQTIKYVGTGIFGTDKPTVLNFNFVPKVFFIGTENDNAGHANAAVAGCGWISTNSFSGTTARPGYIVFEGTKVSMYAQSNSMYYNADSSYNNSGYKYVAVAIG